MPARTVARCPPSLGPSASAKSSGTRPTSWWATPDEAAFDMEQLDYDFHLFTEAETGQDSVIYHSRDGYRLAQVEPAPYRLGPVSIPLTVSSAPAPVLSVSEAVECLEATGMPFIFFADASTGRGSLLYHRYDGHYGLITPSR
ncbi:sigma 54 modulation/S30EA ribosomal C-terminal domain-containing protein [Nonomuraea sp. B19D2]|uniref:sigma 54 modulation/S30EA ribosomal C-terminal domain-containing protein n=1 Tax=Nonomuraea sp. B19D2 TaxID=3159561 RepID=UPI0032DAEC3D